jgi:tryptophan synthase beta chain
LSSTITSVVEEKAAVEIPRKWYNINPDLPKPLPPILDPKTRERSDLTPLKRIYLSEAINAEFSQERWIEIPDQVRDFYSLWRPTRLVRARYLEQFLDTPAKIYYKNESVSPSGSHKANTAAAQTYWGLKQGVVRLVTNTTAGQWGSALAFACKHFGLKCGVYMARSNYEQKPYRGTLMRMWDAEVYPSPGKHTKAGRAILKMDPKSPGSIGIAKSEALEDTMTHEGTRHAVGSVMSYVLRHNTVIGLEAKQQMDFLGEYPDMVVGCFGGGSSFAGLFWPYYYDKFVRKASPKDTRFLAVESTASPRLTKGQYRYDHSDPMRISPLFKMYTLGHTFVPPPVHTGGLRVHGSAPTFSLLLHEKLVEAVAFNQLEAYEAGLIFSQTEGIVPAPEAAHAIKAVIDEAKRCKKTGEKKVLLFNLCGHGYFDLHGYEEYISGKMTPSDAKASVMKKTLRQLDELYPWDKPEA